MRSDMDSSPGPVKTLNLNIMGSIGEDVPIRCDPVHQQNAETSDQPPDNNTQISVLTNISQILSSSLRWSPTSSQELAQAESVLLSSLTRPFKAYFINIGEGWGLEKNEIRTLEMLTDEEIKQIGTNKNSLENGSNSVQLKEVDNVSPTLGHTNRNAKVPLVLLHGFGAGIGTWILNLDQLARSLDRKVYAIDLLGFARSTRAPFDLSGDVEGQFVDSIERWRAKAGLEKFILLGHSFGGYLCASYALRHPDNVSHVILADPWGVQDRKACNKPTYELPLWVRAVNRISQNFNPLAVLRASGPYGPSLVQKFRADLREKFRPKLGDNCHKFLNYIYHCNAQSPTGESAFKSLALPFGWPKNPLINRLWDLKDTLTMTFIYGSRSWIQKAPGEYLRDNMRPNRVVVNEIEGSGHHVYADKYNQFNELVQEACSKVQE